LGRQSEFARRIASALAYPVFLIVLSIGAVIALAAFAGPAIAPLLAEAPDASPALAAVIAAGEALRRHGLAILAGVLAMVLLLGAAARQPAAREALALLRSRLPLVGAVVRDINCGAFARTLGAMLQGGAPAGAAFDLAAQTAPNSAWRRKLLAAGQSLRDGRTVAAALAGIPGAAPELARLARVGEESGALGEMLARAGDLAVERGLRTLDRAAAAAGPILILAMGGFTGWLMSAFLGGLTQLGEGVL
jgi:type II secretory pathway component PulF